VSNLIAVEFLMFNKLQFRKNAQKILHMIQCTLWHVWSRTVTHFQRSRGVCEWFDRHRTALVKCLNVLGGLTVPTDKNVKDWGQANVGAVPRKINVCRHIWMWTLFVVLMSGTLSWSMSKYFMYTLYNSVMLMYQFHAHWKLSWKFWQIPSP
jgi:hypothetical protein